MKQITGTWKAIPDHGEPAFANPLELHWTSDYGPHICATCWGAGWHHGPHSELVKCATCGTVEKQYVNRMLGECWRHMSWTPKDSAAKTFANFQPNAENKPLLEAARAFAQKPAGWLVFYGNRGTGKSHLAEAIARWLLEHQYPAVYFNAPDLYPWLGATERRTDNDPTAPDYDGRLKWLQSVPVLVIDEVNRETRTPAVSSRRTNLLHARYTKARERQGGATVLVSNDTPDAWHGDDIADRAMDARFVQVHATGGSFRRLGQ